VSRVDLAELARRAMGEHGLEAEIPQPAVRQAEGLTGPAPIDAGVRDLRALLWASIDNDDSRDLDQLTVAAGQCRRWLVRSRGPTNSSKRISAASSARICRCLHCLSARSKA
jgi:hypothetical protein